MIPHSIHGFLSGESCDPRPLLGGSALSFDGVDGTFARSIDGSVVHGANVVVSCWVRVNAIPSNYKGFLSNNAGNYLGSYPLKYRFSIAANKFYFVFTDSITSTKIIPSINTINISQWYNVSFKFTGTLMEFYVDGVLQGSSTCANTSLATDYMNIGAITSSGTGATDCDVFGVVVTNDLTAIDKLYNHNYSEISSFNYFLKCDSQGSGTDFESSGNTNTTSLNGNTSFVSTTEYSYRDNLGYSDGTGIYLGAYIPRDESNTEFDVLGNELEYKGPACGV